MAGPLRNLEEGWANQIVPHDFLAWADAISDEVDTLAAGGGLTPPAQTRFVAVNGNDVTGTGSQAAPFLTIAKAMTSITDATSAKPYLVSVGPGVFPTAFTLKPGTYVRGAGSGSSVYNQTPLQGATKVAPAANILSALFAGAGDNDCGLTSCALLNALVADFAAVGSTGQGSITVQDALTESALSFVGSASGLNSVNLTNIITNSLAVVSMTNIGESVIRGLIDDGGNVSAPITFVQSAPIQGFHFVTGCFKSFLTVTWTSALISNFIAVILADQLCTNNPTITGAGAIVTGGSLSLSLTMPDANSRLSFGTTALATMIGINVGINFIACTPTAARTLTIDRPLSSTRITNFVIRNKGTAPIDLIIPAGTIAPGSPSYCPPTSEVQIYFNFPTNTWNIIPIVQAGAIALVAGVSPFIPADVTANTIILATLRTISGAFGTPKSTGRVIGSRAGGGGFTISSFLPATGAIVATDASTYDWGTQEP
jgi:hypothetical protein